MAKEQTITEELANARKEGEPALQEKEKETPAAPPAEKTEKEEAKVEKPKAETDNIPFHKHPRWIERERQQKKQIEEMQSHFQSEIEALRKTIPAPAPTVQPMPQWFANIYGDNPEAWKEYSSYDAERRKEIKEELRKELAEERKAEKKDTDEINRYFDQTFEAMRDEGMEFDENELMRIALKYELFDGEGKANLRKAYEVYQDFKPAKPATDAIATAKKELAAATVKRTTEAPKREYATPKDFKGKSWRDLIK